MNNLHQLDTTANDGKTNETGWYTFTYDIGPYTIRAPWSAETTTITLPGPGPTTVRLAVLKNAFEFFDRRFIETTLFPVLMSMPVLVSPPERLAIDTHTVRMIKSTSPRKSPQEGIGQREIAEPTGPLRISVCIPTIVADRIIRVFEAIGYWGTTSSLCFCIDVARGQLPFAVCGHKLSDLLDAGLNPNSPGYLSEVTALTPAQATWEHLVTKRSGTQMYSLVPFLWPLRVIEELSTGRILERCSLEVITCDEVQCCPEIPIIH